MQTFWQDLRYAFRMLAKSPGLVVVIVFSLAIGIGANSAIFSVVDALLLRPLPYPHPERLAAVWLHSPGIGIFRDWPSPASTSTCGRKTIRLMRWPSPGSPASR